METKIHARGPWVLIKPEVPPRMSQGGLYLPEGNLLERLGHAAGMVVSVSDGYYETPKGKKKTVFVKMDLKPGDRVLFRGHLQDAHKVEDCCFIHIRDIIVVLDKDAQLDLAMPH